MSEGDSIYNTDSDNGFSSLHDKFLALLPLSLVCNIPNNANKLRFYRFRFKCPMTICTTHARFKQTFFHLAV